MNHQNMSDCILGQQLCQELSDDPRKM